MLECDEAGGRWKEGGAGGEVASDEGDDDRDDSSNDPPANPELPFGPRSRFSELIFVLKHVIYL